MATCFQVAIFFRNQFYLIKVNKNIGSDNKNSAQNQSYDYSFIREIVIVFFHSRHKKDV